MTDLAYALQAGDRRALARSITLVENRSSASRAVVCQAYPHTGGATVLGITGPPGVGKSTLLNALLTQARGQGRRVGVLMVDPSSPLTSGALLGDRVRLDQHYLDPGVFIRSMATRGALGGLARTTFQAALLLDAAGFDPVIVETVGVGQVEIDVAEMADVVVLCLMPGAGDVVQALKSGIMEVPDIVVVTRGDDDAAESTLRDVREALRLRDSGAPLTALKVDAVSGTGVADLWETIATHRAMITDDELYARRRVALRKAVLDLVIADVTERVEVLLDASPKAEHLLDDVAARLVDPIDAARQLLDALQLPQAESSANGGCSDARN